MNNLDARYQALLEDILHWGVQKTDRTGTGTISVFGRQIRHKMSEGFPLLTTKKMAFKTIVTELLWFLRGDTNIKFLLDYDCHIWDGDAYKNYVNYPLATIQDHRTNVLYKNIDKGWCVLNGRSIASPHPTRHLTKEEFINKIKTDDEFAKQWGELGPIYGKQWRSWNGKLEQITNYTGGEINPYFCDCQELFEDGHSKVRKKNKGIDQIANLINELKTNPDSRRLMVSAWNVGELDQMVLPPCHYGFQVYTRELSLVERIDIAIEKGLTTKNAHMSESDFWNWCDRKQIPTRAISLMWNQRSVDTFLGLPFNIASYGLLLEIIAKEVNMVPEELIGNLGDTHLYLNHIEQAKEQILRTPYELPKIKITERNWYMHEAVKEHLGEKTFNEKILSYRPDCFELIDYQSHPKIKAPLSN
jgi:thymidylate synthase